MNFRDNYLAYVQYLLTQGDQIDVGEWQSQQVTHPLQQFLEVTFVHFPFNVPQSMGQLMEEVEPDLPWAEDHFQERVSGEPLNPPPSEAWWPWRDKSLDNAEFKTGQIFSHTYPERYWPKQANFATHLPGNEHATHWGIRYGLGDLGDVVNQLKNSPLTRQAYLPVWFPEDTGAVHGERVPCSLGYHFLIRNNTLHCAYYIRSCDLLRHFRNDVYMTARLMQWVRDELQEALGELRVGMLHMHISSLHAFKGDEYRLTQILKEVGDEDDGIYGAAV